MANCVHIDLQAVLISVQNAADRGVTSENVIHNLETSRVADNDGGDGKRRANMSKAHVSSVFDYVVDNEDADSTVCGGVSRLLTEGALASKYDGNAVVHAVPAARVRAAGGARRGAPVNIGRLERVFLPAVVTSCKHEARGNKRRRLELCVAPQLHCGVSMDGSILKV